MENQVTNNANALRLFFTEDVFLVEDKSMKMVPLVNTEPVIVIEKVFQTEVKSPVSSPGNIQMERVKTTEEPKLYPIEAEVPRVLEEPVAPGGFKFLGGNKKSVLILVHDDQNEVSTEQGRELLRKIVKAVDLGTPDFAILNYANFEGTGFVELHQFFKPQIMLSFGVAPKDLKLDLNWAHEIITHQTTRMIFAPNLHVLDGDLNAKKLLWANLQKIK